ncbi:MAG TPA: tetratricopeptide repeat protein [Candidatus Acidoferrales bacterium]|nr:tetratricopeptide repeat protein [Candidatus Acidoferrales bacterium]
MAYNKSKYVEAAQKLLNQGKVAQAIAEYQQILKYEPRDQVTLMTIGELYIRQGETFQAIDYFERLAQIFVGDGFLTKAIAVYKRIAKLAPEEIRPLEKLADLYVQQGVMSEARPLFLQLAEIHLKNNRQSEAITLLKKLLLAEPDNLRIQIRLADLYQAMGQTKDAVEAYVSAAQRALARGDQAECDKLADKALKLDPKNAAAVIVKARSSSTQGNPAQAAEVLEHVPDLEKGGEQAELLLDIYLKGLLWDKAIALSLRIFEADVKNFGPLQKVLDTMLESGLAEKAMPIIDQIRIQMIDAGEHEVISHLLTELANRTPNRVEPREWLVDMYGRTSDSFRLPDALAQLGDALVATKQYDRAKATFEQLVDRQPESDSAKRKLNDCLRKMGLLGPEAAVSAAHEEPLQAELPKAEAPRVRPPAEPDAPEVAATPAPAGEPALDEETQKFIAQSLTDVDLFASYGLTQKAIGLLEAILRRAPRHTPTLEKLLDFVLGAGDDRRTAELAAQLEQIHTERGDARSAERFGELRRRFQRAAGLSDEDLAAITGPPQAAATTQEAAEPEFAVQEVEAAPVAPAEPSPAPAEIPVAQASPTAAEEVHEVDLSDEWASLLEHKPAAGSQDSAQASQSAGPAEFEVPHEPASVEEFSIGEEPIAAGEAEPVAASSSSAQEISAEEIDLTEILSAAPAPKPAPPPAAKPTAPEPEFEVEQDYDLVIEPEALVPAHDQRPPEKPIVPHPEPEPVAQDAASGKPNGAFQSDQFLADLADEIDQLGIGELTPSVSEPANSHAAPEPKRAPAPATTGPLKEVFDEFRAELGEMGAEDEDLETHYNLGIAFREMGLLEEAISEFQKVAKATDNGRAFRYSMQCCTLLGLAFMEKGQPSIAAIWYERALKTPGMDPESVLALRYDLGVAQESAGDPAAALKSFSQVYAMNIDYRDVAERIAALQKPAR